MKLSEVLSNENINVKFKCLNNNTTVLNNNNCLLFLDGRISSGEHYWRECVISKIWVDSEYEKIEEDC